MAKGKRVGRVCAGKRGTKTVARGNRFFMITSGGAVYDVTSRFHKAKPTKKRKPKRKSTSNFGRKKRGPLKGFASRKQKRAAIKNIKKAQRVRRRR